MSGQAAAPAAGLPAGRRWASLRSRPLRRVASSPASHCRSWRSHARPLVPCPAAAGAAAAGAAAPPPPQQQEQPGPAYSCDLIGGSLAAPYAAPTPLPPHPRSAALKDMLPYLLRLALGDPQLHWRLGVALALLLASKACGGSAPVAPCLLPSLSCALLIASLTSYCVCEAGNLGGNASECAGQKTDVAARLCRPLSAHVFQAGGGRPVRWRRCCGRGSQGSGGGTGGVWALPGRQRSGQGAAAPRLHPRVTGPLRTRFFWLGCVGDTIFLPESYILYGKGSAE